jgi:hypothetical protein
MRFISRLSHCFWVIIKLICVFLEQTKENSLHVLEYYWESYPDKLSHRIAWVFDHIINFRGPGWSWAIPPLPTYPPSVKQALGEHPGVESRTGESSVGFKRLDTRRELFWDRSETPILFHSF